MARCAGPTDENKPYLETAPYLIVIFAQHYEVAADGRKLKNYYVTESVGIAAGMPISAIHMAGLAALTHTPSPMGFLSKILGRPAHEKPFLVLVVGYPDGEARVPDEGRRLRLAPAAPCHLTGSGSVDSYRSLRSGELLGLIPHSNPNCVSSRFCIFMPS